MELVILNTSATGSLTEIVISIASVVISLSAFILSFVLSAQNKKNTRNNLFLGLRQRFIDILEDLPPRFREKDWQPEKDENNAIARYWHHVFDEWYLTNYLGDKMTKKLWSDYFVHPTKSALRYTSIREGFKAWFHRENEDSPSRRKFGKEILQLINSVESER